MDEYTIDIRPLSVNAAWKGRRFKTPDYLQYERDMEILLPRNNKQWNEPIEVEYIFSLKYVATTDVDNLIKPLQDILVRTGVIANDKLIMRIIATKKKNKHDSITFKIKKYKE